MSEPDRFISRADLGWGRSPADYADPKSGLVVHYDSSDQDLASKGLDASIAYWRSTRAFHMGSRRGWVDIGYSFMATASGHILEGRGLRKAQAAQPGGNTTYYSVTLATGPTDEVTPAQIDAVRRLRAWLMGLGVAGTVKGHRDFISTSCPGDRAYRLVKDGTFTKAPGAGGGHGSEDDMLGLEKGDRGDRVRVLQYKLKLAGSKYAKMLGTSGPEKDGVDGVYGAGTAKALLAARKDFGSTTKTGDVVSHYAVGQVDAMVARAQK